jgi:hypothetical protein
MSNKDSGTVMPASKAVVQLFPTPAQNGTEAPKPGVVSPPPSLVEMASPAAPLVTPSVEVPLVKPPATGFIGAENVPANWTIMEDSEGIRATCVSGRVFVGNVKEFTSQFSR